MNAENFVAFFLKERGWEDWQGEDCWLVEKSDICIEIMFNKDEFNLNKHKLCWLRMKLEAKDEFKF